MDETLLSAVQDKDTILCSEKASNYMPPDLELIQQAEHSGE